MNDRPEQANAWASELSVIIPTFNEELGLPACLAAVRDEFPTAEVIVSDGGSRDGTVQVAQRAGANVMRSAPGRGVQCRAGSAHASGAWLLFLHADAVLQTGAGDALRRAMRDPEFAAGTFRLDYRRPALLLRLTGWSSHFDSYFTSFGDQGIVVRRDLHETVGGMPAYPLFEDVEYLRRLRAHATIRKLPAQIVPSVRRYERHGTVRQLALNLFLMCAYLVGVSPERLARWYRSLPVVRQTRGLRHADAPNTLAVRR
jgi:rSAM/selenodomain-associated transferase 2